MNGINADFGGKRKEQDEQWTIPQAYKVLWFLKGDEAIVNAGRSVIVPSVFRKKSPNIAQECIDHGNAYGYMVFKSGLVVGVSHWLKVTN